MWFTFRTHAIGDTRDGARRTYDGITRYSSKDTTGFGGCTFHVSGFLRERGFTLTQSTSTYAALFTPSEPSTFSSQTSQVPRARIRHCFFQTEANQPEQSPIMLISSICSANAMLHRKTHAPKSRYPQNTIFRDVEPPQG